MKYWYSKNGSGHGGNLRSALSLYRKHPWKTQELLRIEIKCNCQQKVQTSR